MKKSALAVPFIILSLVLAGCAGTVENNAPSNTTTGATDSTPSPQPTQEKPKNGMSMEPQTSPALTDDQSKELQAGEADHTPTKLTFTVHGGNFYFTPTVITVKKGDTVKINFVNDGGMHNWVLDEFKATMEANKTGETSSVEFVADKVGTFEFYCSVGSHRKMGMKGTLIVKK